MKKKVVWITALILLAAVSGYYLKFGSQAVQVSSAAVQKGDISEYIEETGVVRLQEETSVYSSGTGKVLEIPVEVGEAVKQGDTLARMDDADILLQIKVLEAQKQALAARYEEEKKPIGEEELRKLNAALKSAEAAFEEAKRTAESSRVLYEAGAMSLDMYKGTEAKLISAEANLDTAISNLAIAERGISSSLEKQYAAQFSELEASIDQLRRKAADMIVRAPISGTVLSKPVKAGGIVQSGTLLMELGSANGIFLECDILVEDISGITEGMPVLISNEDLGIKELNGKVRKIYPKAFSKLSDLGVEQKRVKLEIAFEDAVKDLKPGYDMDVKIITDKKKDALLINENAVFEYDGRNHVFVNDNGTAQLRAIETGIEGDEQLEVVQGLKEGDIVIQSPDEKLKEGVKIK